MFETPLRMYCKTLTFHVMRISQVAYNSKIKYLQKFGFRVALCGCFHCNLAAEYSSAGNKCNWSLSCYCLTTSLVLAHYLCVVYSGLVLYFDLTICFSYIVKRERLSLVY